MPKGRPRSKQGYASRKKRGSRRRKTYRRPHLTKVPSGSSTRSKVCAKPGYVRNHLGKCVIGTDAYFKGAIGKKCRRGEIYKNGRCISMRKPGFISSMLRRFSLRRSRSPVIIIPSASGSRKSKSKSRSGSRSSRRSRRFGNVMIPGF